MSKNKQRWESVSTYEIVTRGLLKGATPEEIELKNKVLECYRNGLNPEAFRVGNKIVVRGHANKFKKF